MNKLPIETIQNELVSQLRELSRFVIKAPTGSGKSTRIPQMLVDHVRECRGQVVVLQPRRLAARHLARRVAQERSVKLGTTVGFQIRFENASSSETQIKYVTEGILLRQILNDPNLHGVSAVLFDEFHERHLYTDVTLALALRIQKLHRPDLIIGVMSATLESEELRNHLEPCALLTTTGRTHPVEMGYSADARAVSGRPVWEQAAWHANRLCSSYPDGHFLIFMPGAFEINRTIRALALTAVGKESVVLPLYGDLPPEKQDAAFQDHGRRKIIVATNVAETSVTIENIRVVIDSGLARIPAFDPHRGINTLLVQNISRSSADQRAGRAGRTAPGYCLRLWGEREHEHLAEHEKPEIQRLDLSEILLMLKAGGIEEINDLPWLEKPVEAVIDRAHALLRDLGATDRLNQISACGKKMAAFPVHPRYSRMFLTANESGCLDVICILAAFTQVRSLVLPLRDKRRSEEREERLLYASTEKSDFLYQFAAWQLAADTRFNTQSCREWGIHAQAARQAASIASQFLGMAKAQGLNTPPNSPDLNETAIRKCLMTGFSDQLAVRKNRGTRICDVIHGRRGEISKFSILKHASLFVSSDIEERNQRGGVNVLLGMNTAVEEPWLQDCYPEDFQERKEVRYDVSQRRVVGIHLKCFRDLVLEEKEALEVDPDKAATLLAEEVLAGRLNLKKWDSGVERLISRINFSAHHCPEYEITAIGDADRQVLLEQICFGATRYREIKDRDVMAVIDQWLPPGQSGLIDHLAPERYVLPNGRQPKIRYEKEGTAILAATIQHLYDASGRIMVGGGKVPVLIEILAPNQRPVQRTENLDGFWKNAYPDIRKQLKGRYPKHEWR